jgi:hypothetical protein
MCFYLLNEIGCEKALIACFGSTLMACHDVEGFVNCYRMFLICHWRLEVNKLYCLLEVDIDGL